jgi:nicotinate-nucleotide--dimethylbenzimidazole phosphoribosyltransferase
MTSAAGALSRVAELVEWPDTETARAAREHQLERSALGRLAAAGEWISGAQGRFPPVDFLRARAVVFAADHGIAAAGVSRHDAHRTAQAAADILAGRDAVNVFAGVAGVGVRLVDVGMDAESPALAAGHKVRRASGRIDREDALTGKELQQAIEAGIAIAEEEIDAGADLLVVGSVGAAGSTVASTLVAVITDTEPAKVVGRGSGIDDDGWMRKVAAVRDARRRAVSLRGEPERLLAVAGGVDVAAIAGFLLRAAARRTPVILDGLVTTAGAVVAHEAAPRAMRWWLAGQLSGEPGHPLALARLGLEPLLDLGINSGTGAGALAAVPLLRAAIGTLRCASTA